MSNLARQFEELWESSDLAPDVFRFIAQQNNLDAVDLLPVLLADQELRWKTDQPLRVEDYVRNLPSLTECPNAILDLLLSEFEYSAASDSAPMIRDALVRLKDLSTHSPEIEATKTDQHLHNPISEASIETRSLLASAQQDSTFGLCSEAPSSSQLDLNDYELIEEVGRGGMGVVYKARQRKLNRLVALKVIKSGEFAHPEQIQRFQSEAKALAKLDHEGIVPVYDVGQKDGQHYFSMAFVDGRSLSEQVKAEGPLLPKQAAFVVRSVAEALKYAHQKGVIHRDIKPHNILIESENGKPRLTDFGLAKHLEADSELTATGQAMGTPSYMPPEQAVGQQDQIGVASDIYSLGATLYFLLVARPPFQAASAVETIRQVLDSNPASPRSLNSNVPRDLETICLKCLSKEPAGRYATSGELADDLQRWLNGEPIWARPVSRIEEAWKWCKRRPALVGTAAGAILVLTAMSTILINRGNSSEATRLVEGLLQAETSKVDSFIDELSWYQSWAQDDLQQAYVSSPEDSNARLHAALALLPSDKSVLPFLKDRLLTVSPVQFESVRNLLDDDKTKLVDDYWKIAKESETPALRFQAACALASYDPDDEHWGNEDFCTFVANHLVGVLPSELLPWRNALRPIKERLAKPLAGIYSDASQGESVRDFATDTLAEYQSDDAEALFDLLAEANEKQFTPIFERLSGHQVRAIQLGNTEVTRSPAKDASEADKEALAMRQANAAVMLLRMNAADQVWPLLKHSPDPRVRSYIIHWVKPRGGDVNAIIARYEQETDVTIKRALLLCLGEFELVNTKQQALLEKLLEVYRRDPDAGLHAAAGWLLRQWQQGGKLAAIDQELQQNEDQLTASEFKDRQWYINSQGQTFVILDAKGFQMGSPKSDPNRNPDEFFHRRTINRRFAIAATEVTHEQFKNFEIAIGRNPKLTEDPQLEKYIRSADSPQTAVTWYEAAWYCNWLSEQEGIDKDQWCYEPNRQGKYAEGMKPKDNYLELAGYRLPSEAEWEYACRAASETPRYYGGSSELLGKYGWYANSSNDRTWPIEMLKPNDHGLFDMYGNAWEWCNERHFPFGNRGTTDARDTSELKNGEGRELRGGAFDCQPLFLRSAFRTGSGTPEFRDVNTGFRPARTIPLNDKG